MPHLLHLDTSLRTEGSRSRRLSAHFAEQWLAAHPGGTVTYRDLAADPIPHLHEAAYTSVFTAPEDRTSEQLAARVVGDAIIEEVLAADTVAVGMPLYNFGPPTTFITWFERLLDPERTMGRLGDKDLVFLLASGGGYGPGTPRHGWDHREPLLRHMFEPLGVTDPRFVRVELTLARESPNMIPLDLGAAEDQSFADGLRAIDELVADLAAADTAA